jgi:hypothetical protein
LPAAADPGSSCCRTRLSALRQACQLLTLLHWCQNELASRCPALIDLQLQFLLPMSVCPYLSAQAVLTTSASAAAAASITQLR